ncbi:hypothetical protein CAPGI0001_1350 [Capnocytophaga gingivalis ATCC 33624]|nr:hypothetical protein CAPGI0001_1350 [Capnocytophaga gingivalis ATCC 33624]
MGAFLVARIGNKEKMQCILSVEMYEFLLLYLFATNCISVN